MTERIVHHSGGVDHDGFKLQGGGSYKHCIVETMCIFHECSS